MAGRIVVGVDGSELGRAALEWAVAEARLRDATVAAVHAWSFVPPPSLTEPGLVPMPAGDLTEDLERERNAAGAVLDEAIGQVETGDVRIEGMLVETAAGDALVDASEGANLVVVGSHGRGGLASALLGSVSQHVVRHAGCPVVIIRARGA
jgi:nucleotide-binding universal stress UspA family protein